MIGGQTDYSLKTDYELVFLLKDDDRGAFTAIYDRYVRLLYTLIMRYVKNHDDSQDILQFIFEKLWLIRKDLNPEMPIKNFLYAMTRNSVLNYVRDHNSALQHNYQIVQQRGQIEDDIFAQAEKHGEIKELFAAIDKLPEQQRKVAQFRCEGFSNKEISKMMGLSLNTVNTHYKACLKNLKKHLSFIVEFILIFIVSIWNL